MFYELRRYRVLDGKMDEWVQFMDEEVIPFQIKKGMVITASFRGEDNATYVWMRRFASEEECKRLYQAVYESDEWRDYFTPRVSEMLDREAIEVTRVVPTPHSVAQ